MVWAPKAALENNKSVSTKTFGSMFGQVDNTEAIFCRQSVKSAVLSSQQEKTTNPNRPL